MRIGIALDDRRQEKRVALRPEEIMDLARRHQIFVERGAGLGVGISDEEYKQAGVHPASKSNVYSCPLVVKLREPNETELKLMRPGSTVFSMMHFHNRAHLARMLRRLRINSIAMEKVKDHLGDRMIEDLHEVGCCGMQKAFELWGRSPAKATVKILGYGKIAIGAIQAASRAQARVILINNREMNDMERHLPGTDILVDGLTWPAELRGKVFLVTRGMLRLMNPRAAVIGLVSNPLGQYPIETMRPTTLSDISYTAGGVIHAACWGWSGLDPVNVTRRFSIQIAPILADIARHGLSRLPPYLQQAFTKGEE
jgi:alanine dehydrogenase